jgi:hypothetical protein
VKRVTTTPYGKKEGKKEKEKKGPDHQKGRSGSVRKVWLWGGCAQIMKLPVY